jgi:hypothetical protein
MPNDIIDYSNTVFYKIYCNDATVNDIYVGHTTNFVQRKYNHKRTCNKETYANHNLKVYKCIRQHGGWDNWKMEIIGFRDCYDHYEARKIEQKYFETLQANLNSIEPLPKPKPRPITIPKEKREKSVWYCDVCKTTCDTKNTLIAHQGTKKHKRNSVVITDKIHQTPAKFSCDKCDFKCGKKSDFNRHLNTAKHKMMTNNDVSNDVTKNALYTCSCSRSYTFRQSYYRHKKSCKYIDNNNNAEISCDNYTIMNLITHNKELMNMLTVQNQEHREETNKLQNAILELVPKIGNNTAKISTQLS